MDFRETFTKAVEAYESGRLFKTLELCDDLLRSKKLTKKQRCSVYALKSDALLDEAERAKDQNLAKQYYESAIKTMLREMKYRLEPTAIMSLGHAYYYIGKYKKSAHYYSLLSGYEEYKVRAFTYLGEIYVKMNKILEARSAFEKALKSKPDHLRAVDGLIALKEV